MLSKLVKFILIASFILPLGYTTWTIYPSHFGKTAIFQMAISIALALAYYVVILRQKRVIKLDLADYLVLAFTGASFISLLLGDNFTRGFWGDQSRTQGIFTWLHFIAFYFLLRQFLTTSKDWFRALAVVLAVSAISSLIAWLGPFIPGLAQFIQPGRLSGLIGNPIFFGNYLLLPIFFGGFAYYYFRDYGWRWLWPVISLLNLFTLLASRTRGPLVGLAAGVLVIVLVLIFLGRRRARLVGSLLLAATAAILILGYMVPAFKAALPDKAEFVFSISPSASTGQTRLMAWQIALKSWQERPLFGHGPESYQNVFDRLYNPEFLKFSFSETVWDQPHNYSLEILSSRGLVGLILYWTLIAVLIIYLWRLIRVSTGVGRLGYIFLLAGLVGYMVQLTFSFETTNSWQLWWVLIALIIWLRQGAGLAPLPARRSLFEVGLVLVVLLSAASLYFNYQMLRNSYYTSLARDAATVESVYYWQKFALKALASPAPFIWETAFFLTKDLAIIDGSDKLDREVISATGPKLENIWLAALAKYPDIYLYKLWLAQLYTFMGQYLDQSYYAKSEQVFLEAWQINKGRQSVPLLLSKAYFLQGKIDESVKILQELVTQDPSYEQPHWFLGLALVRADRRSEGIAELEKGRGFGLSFKGNFPYLIDIYAQEKQYDKIVPLYQNLIAQEPENYINYARLAATEAALNNKEAALVNIEKAVSLNPALSAEAEQFIKENKLK